MDKTKETPQKDKKSWRIFNNVLTREDAEKLLRDFSKYIEWMFQQQEKNNEEILQRLERIEHLHSVSTPGIEAPQSKNNEITEELSRFKSHEEYLLKELLEKYDPYAFDDETKNMYEFILDLAKSRVSVSGQRYELIQNPEDYADFFIEKTPRPGIEKNIIIPALVKSDKDGHIIETIVKGYIIKAE